MTRSSALSKPSVWQVGFILMLSMALASVALLSPSRAQGADGGSGIGPEALRSGFEGTPLAAVDDNSTGLVPIGFTINFFGTDYTDLFVNNNGNVTFDDPLA